VNGRYLREADVTDCEGGSHSFGESLVRGRSFSTTV
jgi:hypothetical protein